MAKEHIEAVEDMLRRVQLARVSGGDASGARSSRRPIVDEVVFVEADDHEIGSERRSDLLEMVGERPHQARDPVLEIADIGVRNCSIGVRCFASIERNRSVRVPK